MTGHNAFFICTFRSRFNAFFFSFILCIYANMHENIDVSKTTNTFHYMYVVNNHPYVYNPELYPTLQQNCDRPFQSNPATLRPSPCTTYASANLLILLKHVIRNPV